MTRNPPKFPTDGIGLAGLARGFAAAIAAERDRWALWLPAIFGAGVGIYFALSVEPPLWLGVSGLAAAVFSAVALRRWRPEEAGMMLAGVVGVLMLAAGFTAAQWRTVSVAAPVLQKRIGPTTVSGRIAVVETFPKDSRVTLERVRIAGVGPERTPEKVRLRLRGGQPSFTPGQWLRVRAIVSPPPPPAAPGAFDFQRQSYFQRLGGVGFSVGSAEITAGAAGIGLDFFGLGLAQVRQAITQRVLAALPGREGAVAAALMTGDRSAIPEAVLESMRDSGLAHLLAISGLHIGLIAGILFIGLRTAMALVAPLALYYPIKKIAAAVAIVGAFAYALIAGATVPTQRAFLMVGLMLLAVTLDRRGLSIRLVAWAALAVLLLQPESLLGPSFQMSFAAVVALIAAYEAFSRRHRFEGHEESVLPPWLRKAGLYVAGVALTTLIAGTATAPFAIYHFNRFADFGLAANMVAVPVTALWVMPWAVAAFLLMPFGLEFLGLAPMGWGVGLVIAAAGTVASWPGAVTLLPAMPTAGLTAITLGGLWLCLWRTRWRLLGAVGIAAGFMTLALVRPPDMLVDGEGRLMAVRSADGAMSVSTLRRGRFDRDIWLRRLGQDEVAGAWPKTGRSRDGRLHCDVEGCLYRVGGRTVAIAYEDGALAEDCWSADLVVAVMPVRRRCPATAGVIDRFDLWRQGGHAIWLEKAGVRVETVNGVRGRRPWVLRPPATSASRE
jgi:competence protein ComEC